MKFKKILSLALSAALLCAALCVPACAADGSRSFSFALTSGGQSAVEAREGDEISVSFSLKRTDSAEQWAMYAWQTEIAYDAAAFEIVEGSVTAPNGVGSSLHIAGRTGKVYFNDFSLSKSGDSYPAELGECGFTLRVLGGGGDYSIRNTNYKVSTQGGADVYTAAASDLTVTLAGTVASARFTDVPTGAWYEDAVGFVVDRGLFDGIGNNLFDPNGTLTRAMLVTVLWRLEGEPAYSGSGVFSDVQSGAWYESAVRWASANKIVDGYGNGVFGPNDSITREQMATILLRYSKFKGYDVAKTNALSAYTDAGSISSWALDAMKWANAEGLINGTTTTTLAPTGTATRAQVATILMRYVNNIEG